MFIFSKETNKFEYNQIFQTTFLKIFKYIINYKHGVYISPVCWIYIANILDIYTLQTAITYANMEEISRQAFIYIFADENKSIDVRINLCILDYYIK